MNKKKPIKFSKKTLDFLVKAGRQKKSDWLEKNKDEYEEVLRKPFVEFAEKIKSELKPLARDYHFPTKGLGRIKRPAFKVANGQDLYKDWISMIPTRPSKSRFESHPHLFFGLFPNEKDKILLAGGLWQPSSQQTRLIREAIYKDSEPFHELFEDSEFKKSFKTGFSLDKMSKRVPRGFDEDHPDIEWLKLKNFILMKKVPLKDFSSAKFGDYAVRDFKQALRMNKLLDAAIRLQWPPKT